MERIRNYILSVLDTAQEMQGTFETGQYGVVWECLADLQSDLERLEVLMSQNEEIVKALEP